MKISKKEFLQGKNKKAKQAVFKIQRAAFLFLTQ